MIVKVKGRTCIQLRGFSIVPMLTGEVLRHMKAILKIHGVCRRHLPLHLLPETTANCEEMCAAQPQLGLLT